MRSLRSWFGVLGTLAVGGSPGSAGAQPVGAEFQVNTYTTGDQRTVHGGHLSAADASGNFVVVWNSDGQGVYFGIFGQRYDSGGTALGSEFRVNSFTPTQLPFPSVAAAADGDFVVVWDSLRPDTHVSEIFGQRYDGTGVAQGEEFRVNSFTTDAQFYPSVGSDASGNFVVVWDSYSQDGNSNGIFGQRYDSGGVALGAEFRVNSYTTSQQRFPSVASDASGNFVVVWQSYSQDGDSHGIFGQRYDSAGVAQGDEFRLNSFTTLIQRYPSIASDASGNFVVGWNGVGQGDSYGIFGQRYDSAGMAQGNEFLINSYTNGAHTFPSVGALGINQFVVAWESYDQDGSGVGVFGQRYKFADLPSLSISDVSLNEGSLPGRVSRNYAIFVVSLSDPSAQPVAIDYATANGTAMAPSDYTANSGTLTLSPGQTSGRIAVRVREDNMSEGNETFFVNLSNPVNATIADGQGVRTILNDDP